MEKRQAWRQAYAARTTANLEWYLGLRDHRCELCDHKYHRVALAFHHIIPGEKNFNLEIKLWGGKEGPRLCVLEEADGCALLCHNCHAMEHLALREGWSLLAQKYPHINDTIHWRSRK